MATIEENAFFYALGGNEHMAKEELRKLSHKELVILVSSVDDFEDFILAVQEEKKKSEAEVQ